MMMKKLHKVKQVGGIERTVFELKKTTQLLRRMLQAKLVWLIIHEHHQFPRLLNDSSAVAPGKNGGKETGNFNILHPGKQMWYADGIAFNKKRLIIGINLFIEKFFKRCSRHAAKIHNAS
jgi:hypothetical protein